jgi:DNA-binding NarL/FixJ family response regulator
MRALLERSSSVEADCCCSLHALDRRLAAERADAVVWFAGRVGAEAMAEVAEIRRRSGLPLCIVAERVDAVALREAYAARADGIAVVTRKEGTDANAVFRNLVQLLAGSVSMTPDVLDELLESDASQRENPLAGLTAHELAVLELVALGLRNAAIAQRLGRSRKLVEKQVGRVFAKLGLRHDAVPDLDRRVTAARVFLLGGGVPPARPERAEPLPPLEAEPLGVPEPQPRAALRPLAADGGAA